jgi:type I restriction enzyme S subunit
MTTYPWPTVPVTEVCSSIVDCVNKTAPTVQGPTPYRMIRTTNVRGGFVDLSEVRYAEEPVYRTWTRRQVPRRGDVILTREAPLGEVGILRDDEGIFLGQRLMSYRVDPRRYDARFLLYVLLGPDLQAQIRALGSGSTVEHMRVPDAERLMVPLPPLDTQRRIAGILSAYDDLIENNERRIAILEEMARRVFREWFVDFRFPGYEAVRMVDTEAGRIPEGWCWVRLGEVAQTVGRSVTPATSAAKLFAHHSLPAFDDGQRAVIEPGSGIQSNKLLIEPPVVLVSKLNPRFDRTWLVEEALAHDQVCSTEYVPLKPRGIMSPVFLHCSVKADEFRSKVLGLAQGTSTSHQRAKPGDLLNLTVCLPSGEALALGDAHLGPLVRKAKKLRQSTFNMRRARDLLLPRLVSGELSVPTDEPILEAAE